MACDGTQVAVLSDSYFQTFDLTGAALTVAESIGDSYTTPSLHGAGGVWAIGVVRTREYTRQVWAGSEDGFVTVRYTERWPGVVRWNAAGRQEFRLSPFITNYNTNVTAWPTTPAVEVQADGSVAALGAGRTWRIDAAQPSWTDDDEPLPSMEVLSHLRGINARITFSGDGAGNYASLGEGPLVNSGNGGTLVGSRMAWGLGGQLTAVAASPFVTTPAIPQEHILSGTLYAQQPMLVWNGVRWQGLFRSTNAAGSPWSGLTIERTGNVSAPVLLPTALANGSPAVWLLPAAQGSRVLWRSHSLAGLGYLRLDAAGVPAGPLGVLPLVEPGSELESVETVPVTVAAGPDDSVLTLRIARTGTAYTFMLGRMWPDESLPVPALHTSATGCSLTWKPSAHFPADARCVEISYDLRIWKSSPNTTISILPDGTACATLPAGGPRLYTRLAALFTPMP